MKRFLSILEVTVILTILLLVWYKAFDFNAIQAKTAINIFIGALATLAIMSYTEHIAQKHNFKHICTIKKILFLPVIIISILLGLSLLWAIGAASISFGIPFFENAFLAGFTIMLVAVLLLLACLEMRNR